LGIDEGGSGDGEDDGLEKVQWGSVNHHAGPCTFLLKFLKDQALFEEESCRIESFLLSSTANQSRCISVAEGACIARFPSVRQLSHDLLQLSSRPFSSNSRLRPSDEHLPFDPLFACPSTVKALFAM